MPRTPIAATVLVLLLASSRFHAQAADARQFEVASIRRNVSGDPEGSIGPQPGGRFHARNVSLRFIIQVAHDLPAFRLTGGPGWIDQEHYDIQAKAADAVPGPQLYAMMRALLADRFKLALRAETRTVAGFALVRTRANGPLGPGLQAHPEPCGPLPVTALPEEGPDGMPPCGMGSGSDRRLRFSARPLADLVAHLSRRVARPVADRTGLEGPFDIRLDWSADTQSSAPLTQPTDGVSLFTALQEQLGLKLQSERVDAEFFVIDRVERPAED
jgi:uncharacterized protein (TIGR03435 family)